MGKAAERVCVMRPEEDLAMYVLRQVYPDAQVTFCEVQNDGQYDIHMKHPDGVDAAVEVTTSTNEDFNRTLSKIAWGTRVYLRACARRAGL